MADQRKKSHSILLAVNSKSISLELFSSDLWPTVSGGDDLYRVRIDGCWHCPNGKYSFLPLAAVGGLVADLLAETSPAPAQTRPTGLDAPALRVRVHHGECVDGLPLHTSGGWTMAPPHLGPDGRWWIWVNIGERLLVPCDDVEVIDRRQRNGRI